jgi:predicted MPP superfamily phosphohydrolase
MSPQLPRLADLAVTAIIALAQILIGRRFFSVWNKALPERAVRPVIGILSVLWFAVAVDVVLNILGPNHQPDWIPALPHSLVIAVGMMWGVISAASFGLYSLWRALIVRVYPDFSPARRKLLVAGGSAAVALPLTATGFGAFVERTNFQVKEIDLPIPNLHPDLEGLRIGQLSDLHVSPWLSVRDAGRTVDMLNELKPHVIAVTGDLITQPGDPLDETIRELARLRAEAGVVGCLGNHEKYAECEEYVRTEAARYGMDFLGNRARKLRWGNGVLNIVGVDYQSTRDRPRYLDSVTHLAMPEAANLLLSHNPDVFPVAVRMGYEAVLAGHTHGGQVTVEILNQTLNFARFVTPFVAGLYRLQGRSCYVTAGIGTITFPVRLGAKPEITLLRLRNTTAPQPRTAITRA